MNPLLFLPLLTACGRSSDSPSAADAAPRTFTLVYQGNNGGELEPCG